MNNGQSRDGFIKIYLDGRLVLNVQLRKSNNVKFHGIMLHNYWGGSTLNWAPPKDTPIKFSVFCGALQKAVIL